MVKIAVDVVILPPENIMDISIELNRKFESLSRLNKENNLPHITLAMGVIEESEIDFVKKKLEDIHKKVGKIDLELEEVYNTVKPDGKKSYSLRIKKTKELVDLHLRIMKELSSIFTYEVNSDMFNKDESIEPLAIEWVENYKENHKLPEDYHPHISLHCGEEVIFKDIPIKFVGSKLALCHLGNKCTCRKIL